MSYKYSENTGMTFSAYDFTVNEGSAKGKRIILVNAGALEVAFNADNALDVAWLRCRGESISFLSRNGLNNKTDPFGERFDGGFIYTCGLDNVSDCDATKKIHGSFHLTGATDVGVRRSKDSITVSGDVRYCNFRNTDLVMHRCFTVTEKGLTLHDTLENVGNYDSGYVMIYHINYGHPFLDENLVLRFDEKETIPANPYCGIHIPECKTMHAPIPAEEEDLFYHLLDTGNVELENPALGVKVKMKYDTAVLPFLIEWRNLFDNCYVLGVEPSTTRFDDYRHKSIAPGEKQEYSIDFTIE